MKLRETKKVRRIILARHGRSSDNEKQRFNGPDICLAQRGKEQTHQMVMKIVEEFGLPEIILSGSNPHQIECAQLCADILGIHYCPKVNAHEQFRERDSGILAGRHYLTIVKHLHRVRFFGGWPDIQVEGMETRENLVVRSHCGLQLLRSLPEVLTLLIGSEWSLQALQAAHRGLGVHEFSKIRRLKNGRYTVIEL